MTKGVQNGRVSHHEQSRPKALQLRKQSPTAIASDFETFLKMMTTQLKNQDPLNPIDSADYSVQLATFSGVEQQAKTNQLLEAMRGELGMMGMSQMASWVGREARVAAPVLVTGGPSVLVAQCRRRCGPRRFGGAE